MNKALVYWIVLLLISIPKVSKPQQLNLDFLKNKEGILMLKFSLCDKGHDEYCLIAQDIYFNKKRHTIVEYHLLKEIDSFFNRTSTYWQALHQRIINESGNHDFLSSKLFAQEILATGEKWIRGEGGDIFVLKEKNKYYVKDFFIAYKVRGNFALISESLDEYAGGFFQKNLKSKKLNSIFYPLVEALNIHSFERLTKREIRLLGLKRFHLPYYRINTAYEPELFINAGETK